MNKHLLLYPYIMFALILGLSCAPQPLTSTSPTQPPSITGFAPASLPSETAENPRPAPTVTELVPVTGQMKPADVAPAPGKLIYDVESSGTAAPYGDSYKINRFERPFLQDMTYVSDLDIVSFNLSQDADWYYISIELNGSDPNNSIEINYGVEIDLNADGFGDYILWARPPYTALWDASTVQVFYDSDHDTGGLSARQSDAVFDGNGYDTLVFDGGTSQNADPDLAWVRMSAGRYATVQFAFKKSWIGSSFMAGVVADAGLKDVSKFDYNDYFKEADAGSSVRINKYYPLGSLYAVDNTCWQAYGIELIAYQPKFCPAVVLPTPTDKSPAHEPPTAAPPTPTACEPPTDCEFGYDPNTCQCNPPPDPTEEPIDPTPTACEPPTDCEFGYDPDTCQCNPPPDPTEEPIDPTPTACEPPTDCEFGYDPDTCQCNPPPD